MSEAYECDDCGVLKSGLPATRMKVDVQWTPENVGKGPSEPVKTRYIEMCEDCYENAKQGDGV